MVIILLLLFVEARRYWFYDVYRMRIRQFERHYFGQFFQADPKGGPEPWLVMLAQDLRHPKFRISMMLAFRRRLRRNYIWMFLILLLRVVSQDRVARPAAGRAPRSFAPVRNHGRTRRDWPDARLVRVDLDRRILRNALHSCLRGKDRGGDEVHV